MRLRVRLGCVAAVFFAVSGLASGQDETLPDPRLEQKITYAASSVTLQKAGEDLTQKTGVVIRIGSGDRDWRVKERKLHLNLQNQPLGTALRQISEMLSYELRRTGDNDKWTYRIWQNNRGREYEEAMILSQKDHQEQEIAKVRQTLLTDAEAVENMKPEEAAALREKDPWRAYLGGTASGRAYAQILRGLPDDTRELMLRGRKVTLELSEMSPEIQEATQKMSDELIHKTFPTGPVADAMKNLSPGRIVFQPLTPDMGGDQAGQTGMAGLAWVMADPKGGADKQPDWMKNSPLGGMGKGIPTIAMPLAVTFSMMMRVFGKMLLKLEDGQDWGQIQRDMVGEMQTAQAQTESQLKKIVPTPTPTDPALLVEVEPLKLKVDVKNSDVQTSDLVRQLAEKTHLSYAMEVYPEEIPIATALPTTKELLYKLLDRLQLAGLTWDYSKGVVRIRPKDWAIQRSYDVQESFLAGYRKILKDEGWLNLDHLSAVAANLTDGQIQHRFLTDPELQVTALGLISLGGGNREMLRFYGNLDPAQKTQIASEHGLRIEDVSQPQWQRIATVAEESAEGAEVGTGTVRLTIEKSAAPNLESVKQSAETPREAEKDTDGKPAAKASTTDKRATPETATEKKSEPSKGEKSPADDPSVKGEQAIMTAKFTVDIAGDNPDKPIVVTQNLLIPTKTQIREMRKQIDSLNPKPDEPKKAEPAQPDPPKVKPAQTRPSSGKK